MHEDRWIVATLALGLNMIARSHNDNFAERSGLGTFCEMNADRVRQAILSDYGANWQHRIVIRDYRMSGAIQASAFAANLDLICPSLLAGPSGNDMMLIMLQHRMYRSLPVPTCGFRQFSMSVRRDHAFTDAISNAFDTTDANAMSLPWEFVRFTREAAAGDGLINEWFAEAAREITNPVTRLVERQPSGIYSIREQVLPHRFRSLYFSIGRYLALAIVHGRPLGFRLSAVVYGQLIDQTPILDDMVLEEPELVRSLRLMLGASADELEYYPLEINGVEVAVTMSNRQQLVGRKLGSLMPSGTEQQVLEMVRGFRSIIPLRELGGVTVGNLSDLLYGNPTINVEDLIDSFVLEGGHSVTDNHIRWLYETLRSYSNQKLSDFVRFALGTPMAPLGGFRTLNPRITIRLENNVRSYPRSKTCFHEIFLPKYTTKAILQDKLREALANNGAMQD